jgi:hypothetical protein
MRSTKNSPATNTARRAIPSRQSRPGLASILAGSGAEPRLDGPRLRLGSPIECHPMPGFVVQLRCPPTVLLWVNASRSSSPSPSHRGCSKLSKVGCQAVTVHPAGARNGLKTYRW